MREKSERRFFCGEVRKVDDAVLEGVAAVFNQVTRLWDDRFEVIRPGAFARTIADGADVRCLFNHDENLVLARTKSGTLDIWEEPDGLHYRARLDPADPDSARVYAKIARGNVTQSSFYFQVEKGGERFSSTPDGKPLREILAVKLFDVSPVTFPAYEYTSVEARAAFRNFNQEESTRPPDESPLVAPEPALHATAAYRQRLADLSLKITAAARR